MYALVVTALFGAAVTAFGALARSVAREAQEAAARAIRMEALLTGAERRYVTVTLATGRSITGRVHQHDKGGLLVLDTRLSKPGMVEGEAGPETGRVLPEGAPGRTELTVIRREEVVSAYRTHEEFVI